MREPASVRPGSASPANVPCYACSGADQRPGALPVRIDRRRILAVLAGSLAAPNFATMLRAQTSVMPSSTVMSRVTAYAFSFAAIEAGDIKLADHAGKPILVVNTASLCGYTPQYAGLQQLWTRYRQRGLMIIGVP